MERKIDLIYNPKAGGKRTLRAIKIIEDELKKQQIPYALYATKKSKHAIELAKTLSQNGSTDIVAVGGDGTLNEVLNGIDVNKVNFGIIPTGSGNDFAAAAKIPLDVRDALNLILHGEAKKTDYMDCSGVRGINIIGTGIDVEILKRCLKSKILKGKLQYFFSLIVSLIKFKFYNFDVVRNQTRERKDTFLICVANGSQFGGGIKICPTAVIDDNKLNMVLVRKIKRSKLLGALVMLMKGKILEQPYTEHSYEQQIEVCFDTATTVQVDGEIYENLEFNVSLIKDGVKLYRP